MESILIIIFSNLLISVVIYLIIAAVLILIDGKSIKKNLDQTNLSFDELVKDYSDVPPLESYFCKDGTNQKYRYYTSDTNNVLILLHGSGWHSEYLQTLANYISSEKLAHVYTPDLRGHGKNPEKRGDINYINQFEDDIADLIKKIKEKHPNSKLIIGGHSSGGGLAIRFSGSKYGNTADAYMLLSPYLKYNAPTIRSNSGGWAFTHLPRIIGLVMLNNIKISLFNFLPVIDFNMPEKYHDGTETLSYSYRLNTGYAPNNYKKDLIKMKQESLVVIGEEDESFIADNFLPEMSTYKKDIVVKVIENVTHMGIVIDKDVRSVIKEWITNLN